MLRDSSDVTMSVTRPASYHLRRRARASAGPALARARRASRRVRSRAILNPGFVMTSVGVVGLGLLGHAVASRLLAAGHRVIGTDVLPERVDALTTLGGTAAPSARAVAESAAITCTVLPSLAAVEHAILGP